MAYSRRHCEAVGRGSQCRHVGARDLAMTDSGAWIATPLAQLAMTI
jgi:hypothetical protein